MEETEQQEEHVVQGRSAHDEVTRAEQQPQVLGHSSAPPPDAQSGVGASGIPDEPGADGGADVQSRTAASPDQD